MRALRFRSLAAPLVALALVTGGHAKLCGDENTQLTICFPGTQTMASCEYAITNSTLQPASLQACPEGALFGEDCTILPGLLTIAYGPCQQVQNSLFLSASSPSAETHMFPVLEWLDILGLQTLVEVGALLVRGYAFQLGPLPSTFGLHIIPDLQKIGQVVPVTLDNAKLYPLTILGAAVPQLDFVTSLDAGVLIENTPNTNFNTTFSSLVEVSGPVLIVGNAQLTSLDGLEGISDTVASGNLQIIGNPRLTDISALSSIVDCDNSTASQQIVGAIEVIPAPSPSATSSCLLSTQGQVCEFIETSLCPNGTNFGQQSQKALAPLPTLPLNLPLP